MHIAGESALFSLNGLQPVIGSSYHLKTSPTLSAALQSYTGTDKQIVGYNLMFDPRSHGFCENRLLDGVILGSFSCPCEQAVSGAYVSGGSACSSGVSARCFKPKTSLRGFQPKYWYDSYYFENELVDMYEPMPGAFANGIFDPRCNATGSWDASTLPGVGGNPPHYVKEDGNVSVAIKSSPLGHVGLILFPQIVVATGLKKGAMRAPRLQFTRNRAGIGGGALYIGPTNENILVLPGTVFDSNRATGDGGALLVDNENKNVFFYSTQFTQNRASGAGGAVHLRELNAPAAFFNAKFVGNKAADGGAAYLSIANGGGLAKAVGATATQFVKCSFTGNAASGNGGGMHLATLNSIVVDG